MEIEKITTELVDLLEANAGDRITHRDGWRRATRIRLESLGEEAIRAQHAKLTGTGSNAGSGGGKDYNVRAVDHAITTAVHLLERRDRDGNRTFDDAAIWDLLIEEHGQQVASRAIQAALDGAYKIHLGHTSHHQAERAQWNPISLNQYRAVMGDAMPDLPEAEADW